MNLCVHFCEFQETRHFFNYILDMIHLDIDGNLLYVKFNLHCACFLLNSSGSDELGVQSAVCTCLL